VADIWACFEGLGLGKFEDINSITMFADYRVPQILNYFQVLQYSPGLQERLKSNPFIPAGDQLELEIRAASIWSVKVIFTDSLQFIYGHLC
jgi:hypothetical protein